MAALENGEFDVYLRPTGFIDCDHPAVIHFARSAAGGAETTVEQAVRIFNAVRDGIRYDPYHITLDRERFKASVVLERKSGYCVEKALLLTAASRVLGIPGRLHFADVRNHLTTRRLKETMKTDLFIYHGYTEMYLGGRWIKATPTFNRSLCERFGVKPMDFDGVNHAIFHEFDRKGNRHMEYVRDHGTFADLPYDEIWENFRKHYPDFFTREDASVAGNFEEEAGKEQLAGK
ncbi:MAG: transglutaminase family protein [Deltaproteobacteria bacterium]|nr:transglutaminase family protein [Deltaproteobacteria bacterium]